MRPVLQAILIPTRDFQLKTDIMTGYKDILIWEGHRDYHVGTVLFCDWEEPWVVRAYIYEVQLKILSQVTQEELELNDINSIEELLKKMQERYGDITMDSPVTVIRWKNVCGALTRNEEIYHYSKVHKTKLNF